MTAPKPVARITVPLCDASARALAGLSQRTGLGNAALVNRAIQALDFWDQEERAGNQLLTRRPDGTTYEIHQL